MTTRVILDIPAPNHKDIRVHIENLLGDEWLDGEVFIVRKGHTREIYLHQKQRVLIEEQP